MSLSKYWKNYVFYNGLHMTEKTSSVNLTDVNIAAFDEPLQRTSHLLVNIDSSLTATLSNLSESHLSI